MKRMSLGKQHAPKQLAPAHAVSRCAMVRAATASKHFECPINQSELSTVEPCMEPCMAAITPHVGLASRDGRRWLRLSLL